VRNSAPGTSSRSCPTRTGRARWIVSRCCARWPGRWA
jgi:hypothetical protein